MRPTEQEAIEKLGVRSSYAPGRTILAEHDNAATVIVLRGRIKLTTSSIDGHQILIELRGPGDLVGELAALDRGRRVATVTAVSRVEALVIPATRFRELLLSEAGICFAVLLTVADKLRQATAVRTVNASSDVLTRLAGRIVELAGHEEPIDGVIEITSPLTQQELADWIGASRDAVVLALGSMRTRGWIETGRRTIRVLDLPALRSAAQPTA